MSIERIPSNPERRENMPKTLVFEIPTTVPKKLERGIMSEDCAEYNEGKGVFVVADGVSRDTYAQDGYSPAREAAEQATHTIASHLIASQEDTQDPFIALREAFQQGNEAVRIVNEKENLWGEGNHDYLERDLAGSCAAALVRGKGFFFYAYVGDCRIFHIPINGELFRNPDQVMEARTEFPNEGSREERGGTIRKERRNKPDSPHKTYGVLTGEDEALNPEYLKTGSFP